MKAFTLPAILLASMAIAPAAQAQAQAQEGTIVVEAPGLITGVTEREWRNMERQQERATSRIASSEKRVASERRNVARDLQRVASAQQRLVREQSRLQSREANLAREITRLEGHQQELATVQAQMVAAGGQPRIPEEN